jgi:ribosomal protein S27AE
MKKCKKCGEVKPLSEFYAEKGSKDGHRNKCKICLYKDLCDWRKNNPGKVLEQGRRQAESGYSKRYRDSEAGRVSKKKSAEKFRLNYPLKTKAVNDVNSAIQRGEIIRQPCSDCGTKVSVQAHHDDYAKPLDVRWLCRKCHLDWHKNTRGKNNCGY